MTYNPTTWNTGDTITATAMNKIENGIANAGNGILIVHSVNNVLDKTVQEIYDAMSSGIPVYISWTYYSYDSDYESNTYLNPVIHIYTYDNKNLIRICANHIAGTSITGRVYAFTPAIIIFSATSPSSYAEYYTVVRPSASVG